MGQELPPINTSGSNIKSEGLLAGLSKSAGAASKIVAMQAERTKISSVTLPAAYRALGKDCLQQKRHLECASELTAQLRSVLDEIKQISEASAGQDAPQSFTDKAKAAGKQALDVARQKQLGMKRDSLIANIGKAIYSTHVDQSGPVELVAPIGSALARVSEIEVEIGQQSQVGKGSFVTPKRMFIAAAVAVVVVLAAVGSIGGGDAQFRKELAGEWSSTEGVDFTVDNKEIVVSPRGEASFKSAYSTNFSDRTASFTYDGEVINLALKEDGRLLAERKGKVLTLRRSQQDWSGDESIGQQGAYEEQKANQEEKPTREDLINLAYKGAAMLALSKPLGKGPSPEQFIELTHSVARELNAGGDEHSRFLLTLQPEKDIKKVVNGNATRVLFYGSEMAVFAQKKNGVGYVFLSCSINGEQKISTTGN